MISIKKYSKNFINQWNDFVSSANNGTLFSNRDFLNYHINRTFQDYSLLFFKNKKIIAVLPAAIKNNSLHSHPGASYGGIIILNLQLSGLLLFLTLESILIFIPVPVLNSTYLLSIITSSTAFVLFL